MTRLARRLRQEAGSGLTPSLAAALATVERHGPLTPSALASIERVQRPTATRLVSRLEAEGLVSRSPDPGDRRAVLVRITPPGRVHLRALRSRKTAYLARRLDGLAPADRESLSRAAEILERLLRDEP